MKTNIIAENDFWQNRLFDTIQDCHPYMLLDEELNNTKEFIISRANQADEYFCNLKLSGVIDMEAREEAINEVLLQGLLFSPTDYIEETIFEEQSEQIEVPQLVDFYLTIKDLFAEVNYSIYEDIEKELAVKKKIIERYKNYKESL